MRAISRIHIKINTKNWNTVHTLKEKLTKDRMFCCVGRGICAIKTNNNLKKKKHTHTDIAMILMTFKTYIKQQQTQNIQYTLIGPMKQNEQKRKTLYEIREAETHWNSRFLRIWSVEKNGDHTVFTQCHSLHVKTCVCKSHHIVLCLEFVCLALNTLWISNDFYDHHVFCSRRLWQKGKRQCSVLCAWLWYYFLHDKKCLD